MWLFPKEDDFRKDMVLSFNLFMKSKCFDFELFKKTIIETDTKDIIKNGMMLLENERLTAKKLVQSLQYNTESTIVLFNSYPNYFIEEELMKKYPKLEIWVGFKVIQENNKHKFSFSIRSKTDVSAKIAENYSGGGHKNAAGFVCSLEVGINIIKNPMILLNINQTINS